MKSYTIEEIREIAAESGDPEIVARFESYIEKGWVGSVLGITKRPTGKFKPMLATNTTLKKIKSFPFIGSFKYDGVRGILHPEFGPIYRSSKPIVNFHIRETLEKIGITGLDGEILTFTNGKQDSLNVISSKVNSEHGEPDFKFIVFDDFDHKEQGYLIRMQHAARKIAQNHPQQSIFVLSSYKIINTKEELFSFEDVAANESEGLILRNPNAPYKNGKSTLREGGLLKVKRFLDDEGIIVGVNKIADGINALGSLTVLWKKKLFNLGSGWSDAEAVEMWRIRHDLMKMKVSFKYQEIGPNGVPRFASFLAIRKDM